MFLIYQSSALGKKDVGRARPNFLHARTQMQLSFLLFIFFQLGLVMGISVQDTAPSFSAEALMPDASFGTVSSEDYKGTWWILFTYPLDWTFVCPTEIAAFSDRSSEFEAIGCKVVGCSVDSKFSHLAWVKQPRTEGGLGPMNIPLIGDLDKSIATKYGVLLDAGIALRGLFVIDPDQKIRAQMVYDLPVGRDVDEVLRVVRALQFTDKHGEVCPAGWQPGAKTMVPDPEKSKAYFQDGDGKDSKKRKA